MKEKSLPENLLNAGMFQTFRDMPESSLVTFGNFCILSAQDISLICSVMNPEIPDFTSGFFELIPGLLMAISEVERLSKMGNSEIVLDFTEWNSIGLLQSEADRIQAVLCLGIHGGWIVESDEEVIYLV